MSLPVILGWFEELIRSVYSQGKTGVSERNSRGVSKVPMATTESKTERYRLTSQSPALTRELNVHRASV